MTSPRRPASPIPSPSHPARPPKTARRGSLGRAAALRGPPAHPPPATRLPPRPRGRSPSLAPRPQGALSRGRLPRQRAPPARGSRVHGRARTHACPGGVCAPPVSPPRCPRQPLPRETAETGGSPRGETGPPSRPKPGGGLRGRRSRCLPLSSPSARYVSWGRCASRRRSPSPLPSPPPAAPAARTHRAAGSRRRRRRPALTGGRRGRGEARSSSGVVPPAPAAEAARLPTPR